MEQEQRMIEQEVAEETSDTAKTEDSEFSDFFFELLAELRV